MELPCICKKKTVYNYFNGLSYAEVSNEIWEVVMNNRKCSLEKAKSVQKLRKNEVFLIMKKLGELQEA